MYKRFLRACLGHRYGENPSSTADAFLYEGMPCLIGVDLKGADSLVPHPYLAHALMGN